MRPTGRGRYFTYVRSLLLAAILLSLTACRLGKSSGPIEPYRWDGSTTPTPDLQPFVGTPGDADTDLGAVDDAGVASPDQAAPKNECDLTGHWIATKRLLVVSLGGLMKSTNHSWFYMEVVPDGQHFKIKDSLYCGYQAVVLSSIAKITAPQAFQAALREHLDQNGRRLRAVKSGNGCQVSMDKRYEVLGVTQSYYLDPQKPLPKADQPAKDGKPGWEDWDKDGKPGLTVVISGMASGQIHIIKRSWDTASGLVPLALDKFQLWVKGKEDQLKLGGDVMDPGNTMSANPKDHYMWFRRVQAPMVLGKSDVETCKNVRALKDKLLPEGDS